jgi:glycosyltransferase involved in cell wall biosynthesis
MKVLVLVPAMATLGFLEALLESMVSAGWEVHFAASDFDFSSNSKSVDGVAFHRVNFPRGANPLAHLAASVQLNSLVQRISPDVIDVHFSAAMLTASLARRASWPPVQATIQGLRFPNFSGARGWIEKKVESWAATRMNTTFVLTQDDYDALQSQYKGVGCLQVAPGFGCDLNKFSVSAVTAEQRQQARFRARIDEDEVVLIYIGRQTAFKGFHRIVRAFFEAYKVNKKLRLVVCGNSDPMHPTGLSDTEILEFDRHPGISDMGWTSQIADYLSVSHINVFPSMREGMPVNLMESLAMGVPVITYNSRGCRDVVTHERTGLVLNDFSIEALVSSLVDLSSDLARLKRYASCAETERGRFDRQFFIRERMENLRNAVSHSA